MTTDPTTAEDCLRAAMRALLRGDLIERDRLCKRGERLLEAENLADATTRVLAVDFYVTRDGSAIPVMAMARAAGVPMVGKGRKH
jgi:hypothetical protein